MLDGFKARPNRPDPDPVTAAVCPQCGNPVEAMPDAFIEGSGLPPEVVTILACGTCQHLAAHVEGIQDVWRPVRPGSPEDMDRVILDGYDGLRQRRFLSDDLSGIMFGPARRG